MSVPGQPESEDRSAKHDDVRAGSDQDIRAIELLQRRYALLIDSAGWHELAHLFTEDASLVRPSAPDQPIVGRDAILQSLLARPRPQGQRHLVANPEVDLLDRDTARASCFSILLVERAGGGGSIAVGGFRDSLRRTVDGWRFESRVGFTQIDPLSFEARRTD